MRYGFIRLRCHDGSFVFMEVKNFFEYSKYDVFNNRADRFIIFDNIYIGCFPLLFRLHDILDFNPESCLFKVFTNSERGFWVRYAKDLGCVNV